MSYRLLDRIERIDRTFCSSIFRLPAIASRSGEAGGDETAEDNPLARRDLNLWSNSRPISTALFPGAPVLIMMTSSSAPVE